jgi:hypothetical protein
MQGYRLYFMTPDGHIQHRVEFHSETDGDAIAVVEKHRDGRAMELWCGKRIAAKFEPEMRDRSATG